MDLSIYPASFFISAIALILCALYAWKHRREGWGLPMLAVLGTVAVWYHGDGLYNDYEEYEVLMGKDALNAAWWQVLLFVVTFAFLAAPVHNAINSRFSRRSSRIVFLFESGKIDNPVMQRQLDHFYKVILLAWILLMTVALYRGGFNFGAMFTPYLEGWKAKPWSRGRVGGGMSAFLSLANYLQIMLTASFGIVAALSKNPKTRMMAIAVCFLAFPFYIFDRTRNPMIATMAPGLLAWVFLRLRGRLWMKAVILMSAVMLASFWFMVVVDTKMGRGVTVGDALLDYKNKKLEAKEVEGYDNAREKKHEGLSMFSELALMNNLLDYGAYKPSWGRRYFAEAVNVIPRALWKDKPLVGIDYALARGFGDKEGADVSGGGVTASIATGMIGQGVANFGRILGPMCSALLMAIWVSILARLDLRGDMSRIVICVLGMTLTFNMGRDITLFVLYPFVFAYMMVLSLEWWNKKKMTTATPVVREGLARPKRGHF